MMVGATRHLLIGILAVASQLGTTTSATVRSRDDSSSERSRCRYLPGDNEWPSLNEWASLNASISGRLIQVVPLGHVCHDPTYDAAACAALSSWTLPQTQWSDASGFTAAYQQNASCNPFTPQSTPCLQGNYVSYAINVSSAADVSAGIKFAQKKNIRLVIKNTGHDYLGKSTGTGALSIWTHHLKDIKILDYASPAYTGRALKLGAGVQGFEANNAAASAGLRIVGGECLTVGVVGGFTQGGGQSLLSTKYGMGADQTLEWEVVTADGTLVKASPTKNSDLYWGLSGGGPGTYGVVVSLTVKAFPDGVVGGANLFFTAAGISQDIYWGAVELWHTLIPSVVDAGAHTTWIVQPTFFTLYEITITDGTEALLRGLLKPFTDYLDANGVQYQMGVSSLPNYHSHVDRYLGPPPYGYDAASSLLEGGVMFNRSTFVSQNKKIVAHMRDMATTRDFFFPAYAFNVSRTPSSPNAVLPGWRNMLVYMESQKFWDFTVPFEEMAAQEAIMTNVVMPPLQDLAIGAYMNEADFNNPRWKQEFYGKNYNKLRAIKKKWDPKDLFYATTAVGSDVWKVAGDGRLCRA
ncbi:FAD/FMN-containing dehydrogenase [Amniculicola lignicola CBS 123094]|uniref:FAD/FMN-containing dehydrogenase n=1 Tax=Amniculicola lignicola CBS 123094 TaxID=1392246 RepID=A0A6A5VYJ5_9PLEO|nr:FAD/FMN-containing dehydrogenase [Amniculicola lignicola CBS 123094]